MDDSNDYKFNWGELKMFLLHVRIRNANEFPKEEMKCTNKYQLKMRIEIRIDVR